MILHSLLVTMYISDIEYVTMLTSLPTSIFSHVPAYSPTIIPLVASTTAPNTILTATHPPGNDGIGGYNSDDDADNIRHNDDGNDNVDASDDDSDNDITCPAYRMDALCGDLRHCTLEYYYKNGI